VAKRWRRKREKGMEGGVGVNDDAVVVRQEPAAKATMSQKTPISAFER
jgi:hypothetical protein